MASAPSPNQGTPVHAWRSIDARTRRACAGRSVRERTARSGRRSRSSPRLLRETPPRRTHRSDLAHNHDASRRALHQPCRRVRGIAFHFPRSLLPGQRDRNSGVELSMWIQLRLPADWVSGLWTPVRRGDDVFHRACVRANDRLAYAPPGAANLDDDGVVSKLTDLTIVEASAKLSRREVSASDLTEATLQRIEE